MQIDRQQSSHKGRGRGHTQAGCALASILASPTLHTTEPDVHQSPVSGWSFVSHLALGFDVLCWNDSIERCSRPVVAEKANTRVRKRADVVEKINRVREQAEVLRAVEVGDRDASAACILHGRGETRETCV